MSIMNGMVGIAIGAFTAGVASGFLRNITQKSYVRIPIAILVGLCAAGLFWAVSGTMK